MGPGTGRHRQHDRGQRAPEGTSHRRLSPPYTLRSCLETSPPGSSSRGGLTPLPPPRGGPSSRAGTWLSSQHVLPRGALSPPLRPPNHRRTIHAQGADNTAPGLPPESKGRRQVRPVPTTDAGKSQLDHHRTEKRRDVTHCAKPEPRAHGTALGTARPGARLRRPAIHGGCARALGGQHTQQPRTVGQELLPTGQPQAAADDPCPHPGSGGDGRTATELFARESKGDQRGAAARVNSRPRAAGRGWGLPGQEGRPQRKPR